MEDGQLEVGACTPNGWPATAGAYGLSGLRRKQDQSGAQGGTKFWGTPMSS